VTAAGNALLNVGALFGIWGICWRSWDNGSNDPGILLGIGIGALVLGSLLT